MDNRIVCRCEDVRLDEIQTCLGEAARPVSVREIKLQTRAGMGICQGRTCGPLLLALMQGREASMPADRGLTANAPVRPVTLADLAEAGNYAKLRGAGVETNN
jgi:NAD(P)H-nitrite reductase large subunit